MPRAVEARAREDVGLRLVLEVVRPDGRRDLVRAWTEELAEQAREAMAAAIEIERTVELKLGRRARRLELALVLIDACGREHDREVLERWPAQH